MNILIMTSKFGMGHYYAAEAIKEELCLKRPGDNVIICDFMEAILGKKAQLLYSSYRSLIARGSSIYNHIYRLCTEPDNPCADDESGTPSAFVPAVKKAVRYADADVIISTWSGCNKYIDRYISKYSPDMPFITCITDIGIHGKWINQNVDLYLAASEETKRDLIKIGISADKIAVTGIPVRSGFYENAPEYDCTGHGHGKHFCTEHAGAVNAGAVREKRLLVMGGGLGLLPSDRHFYDRLSKIKGLKTTVITGKNEGLLRSFSCKYGSIEFLPFTYDIETYIKNADWLLTKPGGITTFEAVNAATPLILAKPDLQQEAANSAFVARHGLGVLLGTCIEDGIDAIEAALADSEKQAHIKQNMKNISSSFDRGALPRYLGSFERNQKVRENCV